MTSLKWYFADVLEHLFITACALSGHFRGCWLMNRSPLRRLYWWAVNVRWDDITPRHTACPLCRFDRNDFVEPYATTTLDGETQTYRFDFATGRTDRIA